MKYSFDSSAFINPWRRHYPPKHFPSLWTTIDDLIEKGDVVASEEVYYEIKQKDDDLLQYLKSRRKLFLPVDTKQQEVVGSIVNTFSDWIDPGSLKHKADPYVIALARIHGLAVVAYEKIRGPSNVSIPGVCSHFHVPYLDFIGFMDDIGLTL